MRMNVRCCCDPNIVIGTLEVPPGNYNLLHLPPKLSWTRAPNDMVEVVTLTVGEVWIGGYTERAIKSEDRPDEFWDTLPSFRRGDCV